MAIDIAAIQARRTRVVGQRWRWVRWLLGAALIAAGVDRILDLRGFLEILHGIGLLPAEGNWLVALTVPFVELAAGLCLLTGFRPLWAAGFASWWSGLQLLAIALSLWLGRHVPRFGYVDVFARPLTRWSMVEGTVMFLVSWAVLLQVRAREKGILR